LSCDPRVRRSDDLFIHDYETYRSIFTCVAVLARGICSSILFELLVLAAFDSNAHNGYSILGGLIIGLVVGIFVFLTVAKKLNI